MTLKADAKFEQKRTCCLENGMSKFCKFSPEQLKVSKLRFSWDPLIQSRKSMSLKSTEELCVMTMKKDAKFEELTRHFKTDMRNLMNFDPSNWKSQIFSFSCAPFEQRIYCFSWKSTEELSFMKLKRVTKFGEESTCCLKIGISNLTNFDQSAWKSQRFSL